MTSGGHIQLFIEHTRQIATAQGDIQLALQSMQQWREAFATALKQNTFDLTGGHRRQKSPINLSNLTISLQRMCRIGIPNGILLVLLNRLQKYFMIG